jgi:hypothetical protein
MIQKTIRVHPSVDALDVRLREGMINLTPVRFVGCADLAECVDGDAIISLSGDDEVIGNLPLGSRCFHLTGAASHAGTGLGGSSIEFAQSERLDKRLRGRALVHQPIPGYSGIRAQPSDEILARCGGNPVWVARPRPGSSLDLVSVSLPKLATDDIFFDYFHRSRFFQVLPLLHFLREVTAGMGWDNPPLRACLMLDDPNLHWPSYGFLRYEKLLDEAKSRGFHVAFATVPLDAWISHPAAVRLFRSHPEEFSLLAHGNDHSKHELSQSRTEKDYLRLAAQSLRRIDHLEKTTGLHVARVMAPPHGACTDGSLAAMLATGFEGICAATGLLRKGNPRLHHSTFGLKLAEIASGSAPVIPRFRLDSSCEDAIVISAFLNRPIIPVGHHHTASDGPELLTHTAGIINSLGEVSWGGPEMMLRSNFRTFRQDTTLWVEPYSCRIQLTVPPGITHVGLHLSKNNSDGYSDFAFLARHGSQLRSDQNVNNLPQPVMPGDHLEFVSGGLGKVNYREVEHPQFSLSARAFPRRLFCELRDRFMPLIPKDMIPKAWTSG